MAKAYSSGGTTGGNRKGIILEMLSYNKNLKQNSRKLRKNMTGAEIYLWSKVRMKQLNNLQFYRQKIIGDYIVDFFSQN